MFSVSSMNSDTTGEIVCSDVPFEFSTDFYSISLKHIFEGEFFYGRTRFDFQNGCLICVGPQQVVRMQGIKARSSAKLILIHEDFIRGTDVQSNMQGANYFNYAINEALHLSPTEEALVQTIFDTLEQEYQLNHDGFSKEVMLSQLKTLPIPIIQENWY